MNNIKNIVIVGGGTAGWMAAASLAKFFEGRQATITLVESSQIGTVGVGEATIPGIVDFNRNLGIDEVELIKATQASFKLGIQFENWNRVGGTFFHPFADYGMEMQHVAFHHYIHHLNTQGTQLDLTDYSFPIQLARQNKFAQPHPNPPSPLADYSYAYHFDASLYAAYLKTFSMKLGVKWIDGEVEEVNLNPEDGFIQSLQLKDGQIIEGQFFIDCTGFKGLLIEQALNTGYEDWSQWLFCDAAVAVQSELVGEPTPYTRSIARENGWQWRIPLQHRMGNGYIYASRFESNDDAEQLLLANIEGRVINAPRHFRFTPGRRKNIWNKNCFALGLASGFLEPLESTSISLIQTAIAKLLTFFPDASFNQFNIAEVNRLHNSEMEHIRDFLILHYKLSERDDSPFWLQCRNADIPDSLKHKLGLYQSCGHLIEHETESFEPSSWLTMYNAFGVVPDSVDIRATVASSEMLIKNLQQMKNSIQGAASQVISHQAFIDRHCKAVPPKESE
ncbi:tryptophan 7-halogenase [Bowmanella sp. Y26]|uniref:tryptophan halogenase family protein n=1 Tax=Bowmanella yangjiangensis TaxID=2811230 RepID=UPI001BDD5591|nr:tryptophan halogenase family protein [Bowmanella yangjiangensis]MBT1063683.1 tryptophan 7-halogenase [Bowmanella yangjiangensis]